MDNNNIINEIKEKLSKDIDKSPLIHFDDGKLNCIKIFNQSDTTYDYLVKEEKEIFISLQKPIKTTNIDKHIDFYRYGTLVSELEPNIFSGKLNTILEKKQIVYNQSGYNALFLTFGTFSLQDGSTNITAPVIFVPISLVQTSEFEYTLKFEKKEIEINPVLVYYLKKYDAYIYEHDLFIHGGFLVSNFYNRLKNNDILKEINADCIDSMYLTLFDLSTFYLFDDYLDNDAKIENSSIFKEIINTTKEAEVKEVEYEDLVTVTNTMDADESQQKAINASRTDSNFIIFGPPGTGKSQTLGNIIIKALEDNKKILFVSGTLASKNIIYNRFKMDDFHDFLLDLYSDSINKNDVISELLLSVENRVVVEKKFDLNRLSNAKKVASDYDNTLHQIYQPIGLSIYNLLGYLENHLDVPTIKFSFEPIFKFPMEDFKVFLAKISSYYDVKFRLNIIIEDQVFQSIKESWLIQPSFIDVFNLRFDNIKDTKLDYLDLPIEDMSIDSFNLLKGFLIRLNSTDTKQLLFKSNINTFSNRLKNIITSIDYLLDLGINSESNIVSNSEVDEYFSNKKLFKGAAYKEIANKIEKILDHKTLKTNSLSFIEKTYIINNVCLDLEVDTQNKTYKEIKLQASITFDLLASSFFEYYDRLFELFNEKKNLEYLEAIDRNIEKIESSVGTFFKDIFEDSSFFKNTPFYELISHFESFKASFRLIEEYVEFINVGKKFRIEGYEELLDELDNYNSSIEELLTKKYYTEWYAYIVNQSNIKTILSADLRNIITNYSRLDREAKEIVKIIEKERITKLLPLSVYDKIIDFKNEKMKTKGQRQLKNVFEDFKQVILSLKPCILTSPLGVSKYIPNESELFDLVIFDDASMIPLSYCLPAIYRSKKVIVCGDSFHLPPIDLKDLLYSTNDSTDFDSSSQTILDFVSGKLGVKKLKWHYRAVPDDLIYFPNKTIYKNLLSFPYSTEKRGITFHYVYNGVYQIGVNKKEADLVCKLVLDHYQNRPSLSLGVITSTPVQKEYIKSELRKLALTYSFLKEYVYSSGEEKFFIKDLDSLYLEDRDVIIYSLTYGKDSKGEIPVTLKQITTPNGIRRFNVAISRSKTELHLVSSLSEKDFTLIPNPQLEYLKDFINFAERGEVEYDSQIIKIDKSQVEYQILAYLEKEGYDVKPDVHPFIQIGIRDKGDLCYGIQTDGINIHKFSSIRDRLRLGNEILINKGWKLINISVYEWCFNKESVLSKLSIFLEGVTKKEKSNERNISQIVDKILSDDKKDYPKYVPYLRDNCQRLPKEKPVEYLKRYVLELIRVESPIHKSLVIQRIMDFFQTTWFSNLERSAIDHFIATWASEGAIELDGEFILRRNQKYNIRIPTDLISTRNFELIYYKEIVEAFRIYRSLEKGNVDSQLVSFMNLYKIDFMKKGEVRSIINR